MRNQPGVDTSGPATKCMVVGCERTAIYRNRGKRGYCGKHKELAYRTDAPARGDALARHVEDNEEHRRQR